MKASCHKEGSYSILIMNVYDKKREIEQSGETENDEIEESHVTSFNFEFNN